MFCLWFIAAEEKKAQKWITLGGGGYKTTVYVISKIFISKK